MSLVGNLITNYDRSEHMSGAPSLQRRGSESPRMDRQNSRAGGIVVDDGEANEQEVQRLARQYSRASGAGGLHPFDAAGVDSEIDPNSDSFNARTWTKSFLRLHRQSGQANVGRKA